MLQARFGDLDEAEAADHGETLAVLGMHSGSDGRLLDAVLLSVLDDPAQHAFHELVAEPMTVPAQRHARNVDVPHAAIDDEPRRCRDAFLVDTY